MKQATVETEALGRLSVRPFARADIADIMLTAGATLDPSKPVIDADLTDPVTMQVFKGFIQNVMLFSLEILPGKLAHVTGRSTDEINHLTLEETFEVFFAAIKGDEQVLKTVSAVMIHHTPPDAVDV